MDQNSYISSLHSQAIMCMILISVPQDKSLTMLPTLWKYPGIYKEANKIIIWPTAHTLPGIYFYLISVIDLPPSLPTPPLLEHSRNCILESKLSKCE